MKFVTRSKFNPGQTGYYATPENPLMVFGEREADGLLWVVLTRPGMVMGIDTQNLHHVVITGDVPERGVGVWSPADQDPS